MDRSSESSALTDLFDTIEDAVGVGALSHDTVEQIARYLIASGYARVTPGRWE